ncbi:DUF4007 family protein [Halieaceae bacterium IMCC14734]|uniref:DUF4007 family protein n=2 Tax=Candidatus Litorirhabdus singularis TaxID=2518993 RepID=A0ABT3TLK6_9GAMM|nr:DUF4007 family protein [Candidatus Litorirhabdus singularis]
MAGLIDRALKTPNLKDKDLAKPFGYGPPFAATYRSWLHKTGLAEQGLPLVLTPMGRIVIDKDPELESITSLWFLHHELVTDEERAEAWHYFALEFLPKHSTFSKNDLLEGLAKKLGPHSMKHFGPGSKLNQQIARKILQVYTEPAALGELGLIEQKGDEYKRLRPKTHGPWKTAESLKKAY